MGFHSVLGGWPSVTEFVRAYRAPVRESCMCTLFFANFGSVLVSSDMSAAVYLAVVAGGEKRS